MTLQLGIFMALACAFATNLGFLYKFRGARDAASVDIRHPLRSAGSLFGSKWFAIGMLVATGAWGFHVAALALAPMSVVQVVLSGGVVLLAVMAERLFGFAVGLLSPWTLTAVIASVAAFYASARGLQDGEAVPVIAVTGTAANVAGIAGGIIVFGDPLPADPMGIVVQVAAFLMVCVAAALTPAPVRAVGHAR